MSESRWMNDTPPDVETALSTSEPVKIDAEIYATLRRLAARRMAQQSRAITYQPTMLVHEAWMKMCSKGEPWMDRGHFLATAATTMRHILIDNARKKERLRRGSGISQSAVEDIGAIPGPTPDSVILQINEGVQELEKTNPVRAQIVVARFFGGLSNTEIAESLQIGLRSVERHWAAARIWLYRWMEDSNRL